MATTTTLQHRIAVHSAALDRPLVELALGELARVLPGIRVLHPEDAFVTHGEVSRRVSGCRFTVHVALDVHFDGQPVVATVSVRPDGSRRVELMYPDLLIGEVVRRDRGYRALARIQRAVAKAAGRRR